MSLRQVKVWETTRIATDAMDSAVGSILMGEELYQELDPLKWEKRSIAHKEWHAFEITMKKSLPKLRNKVISWDLDDMNVKQAWMNSGFFISSLLMSDPDHKVATGYLCLYQ